MKDAKQTPSVNTLCKIRAHALWSKMKKQGNQVS